MSKNRKFTIGVIIAVIVLVGLGMLRWGSRVYWTSGGERGWSLGAAAYQMFGWGSDNYLADLSQGPMARRGPAGLMPPGPGPVVFTEEGAAQVEVRLVDDDGDGVPDRGVIDLPAKGDFGRRGGPLGRGAHFGRGFGPGAKQFGPGYGPFSRGFSPFFIVGGLFRLAFLALLIGLGIYFYRRWRANRQPASAGTHSEE
jgi:hypothetical protein